MARLQPIIRGAQDCRTLSTAANQTFLPHRTYLRIACLEMEKFRRTQERTSAMRRVENIDRRFDEIDSERDRLLSTMGERAAKLTQDKGRPPGARGLSSPSTGGFRFRY